MVPKNLEEADGLENEVEAALTQTESAMAPNNLEEMNGLAKEFGAAPDQAEQQFAQELERIAAAEAEPEVAPVAGNPSLSFGLTIADWGEQTFTTQNQRKRKIEADNDNGEELRAKRYQPTLQHGEEEVIWVGIIDWDLGDSENLAGVDLELETDFDLLTWGW